jgi:hypothetical protein
MVFYVDIYEPEFLTCNDALLMQWPFKNVYIAPIWLFDGSAMLNFRQTDIQTVQTIWTF